MRQLFQELKRRNVYRVAGAYLVAAFVVVQLAGLAADAFGLPGWFEPMVWVLCGLGFPIALVVAWAFELTPEGVRRTAAAGAASRTEGPAREADEAPGGAGSRAGGRLAVRALAGLGLAAAVVAGAWYLAGAGGEAREIDERTIAVLPFEVSGSGAEEWRDGMVSLLTPGLDGAAGFRAIPDRTVFASWEARGRVERGASSEEAVAVARDVGARYAVVGSAVALGSGLRLTAAVRDTRTGDRLDQVEVRGSPESVMSLADSLTRRVLGVLLEASGEAIPSVDLAGLTTRSLPALKAYLDGERHYRAGEFEAAIVDYREAIERDSAFALAHVRLAQSGAWAGRSGPDGDRLYRRALRLSDRLPLRERRLVWAQYTRRVRGRALLAADSLRAWTGIYPDDPNLWEELGEALYHGYVPGGWPEAERAFEEAVRLDPGVVPHQAHLLDLALDLHRDSALTARRIAGQAGGPRTPFFGVFLDLAFGTPEGRRDARVRLDTLPLPPVFAGTGGWVPLRHPEDRALRGEVVRALAGREDTDAAAFRGDLARNLLVRGRILAAHPLLAEEGGGADAACALTVNVSSLGVPVPDSLVAPYLEPSPSTTGEDASINRLFCSSVYLSTRGRAGEAEVLLERLRRRATEVQDSASAARFRRGIQEQEGYIAWRSGEPERAAELWSGYNQLRPFGAVWRGDVHRELGELERADDWYLAAWRLPAAHERMGRLYEEMGRPEDAAAAYRRFVAAWEEADEPLQGRVERARERLDALTAAQGGAGG